MTINTLVSSLNNHVILILFFFCSSVKCNMLSTRCSDSRLYSFKSLKEKFEQHRLGGGLQRSATHSDMPHRGGTIAERLAALQAAGANDWRARVCRLSPERDDPKAIERAKNRINLVNNLDLSSSSFCLVIYSSCRGYFRNPVPDVLFIACDIIDVNKV
ncbi:unnamed protein product [Leptidea sinapis]|uniref:Uncharacterized protein n=1 Tax=Leptidea sinapis TaxID=189913 RepID=A0A5E4QJR3_9NEOP|nr:unnamed protein product [Leptidea sinapis]